MAFRVGASSVALPTLRLWQRVGFRLAGASRSPPLGAAHHSPRSGDSQHATARSLSARAAKGPVRFQPLQPQTSKKPPVLKPSPGAARLDKRQEQETGVDSYLADRAPESYSLTDTAGDSQGHGRRKGGGRRRLAAGREAEDESVTREWPASRLQTSQLAGSSSRITSAQRREGEALTGLAHSRMQVTAPAGSSSEKCEAEEGAPRISRRGRARREHEPVRSGREATPAEEATALRDTAETIAEFAGRRTQRGYRREHRLSDGGDKRPETGRVPVKVTAERTGVIRRPALTAGDVEEDSASWRSRVLDAIDSGTFLDRFTNGEFDSPDMRDSPVHASSPSPSPADTLRGAYSDTKRRTRRPVEHDLDEELCSDSPRDTSEGVARQKPADTGPEFHAARVYAFRLLNTGMRTEANIRQKLKLRGVATNVADAVLDLLKQTGMQSDSEFADVFASANFRLRMWGPQRITTELRKRGVAQELIDRAIKETFEEAELAIDGTEPPERPALTNLRPSGGTPRSLELPSAPGVCATQQSGTATPNSAAFPRPHSEGDDLQNAEPPPGLSASAWAVVLKESRRKWAQTSTKRDAHKRKHQMAGWLLRRGYPWRTVSAVLQDVVAHEERQEEHGGTL